MKGRLNRALVAALILSSLALVGGLGFLGYRSYLSYVAESRRRISMNGNFGQIVMTVATYQVPADDSFATPPTTVAPPVLSP